MRQRLRAVACRCVRAVSGRVGVAVGVVGVPEVRRSGGLLASVVGLAAGIVTKSLVSASLTAVGMGTAERDYPAAVFATGCAIARCYEPVHLHVHGA